MDIKVGPESNEKKIYIGSCCGNRFLVLDCRNFEFDKKSKTKFASENIPKYDVDSALFVEEAEGFDFSMEIFEKDGSQSESCGNGMILIGSWLGLNKGVVKTKGGTVGIEGNSEKQAILMGTKFSQIKKLGEKEDCIFIKMGEPHVIFLVDDLEEFNLMKMGKKLQKKYPEGVNVDAIQRIDEFHYKISTYERGVFAETKSCGTGALASYLAVCHFCGKIYKEPIEFKSAGGSHWVSRTNNMLKLETLKKFCKIYK